MVDKPLGMTSAQVVSVVRRALGVKKVGHAGTLDPLATGVLPLAVGEATKTIAYIQNRLKTYEFTVAWGESRSTEDAAGEILHTTSHRPCVEDIQAILPRFQGQISQVPPIFSAIKVQGKRAYALARQGIIPTLQSRCVRIFQLDLLGASHCEATFRVVCEKGTYVRSLGRDMAQALGTLGYIKTLRRTQVGAFQQEHALSCEKILEMGPQSVLQKGWYAIGEALDDILAIPVSVQQETNLRRGQSFVCPLRAEVPQGTLILAQRSDGTAVA